MGVGLPAQAAVSVPPGGTAVVSTVRLTAGVTPGPPALIFATKPSPHAVSETSQVPKARFGWKASGVVGRSFDCV